MTARFSDFQQFELTEYQDISVNEKSITSVVVRRDGKLITLKTDDTKYTTTYAAVPNKVAVPVAAVPAKVAVVVPPSELNAPKTTIGKLVLYKRGDVNQPGDYFGDIVDGKDEGNGEVHWRNPDG